MITTEWALQIGVPLLLGAVVGVIEYGVVIWIQSDFKEKDLKRMAAGLK